jgi:cobalamin biosynthesis protein CobD/CbiB
VLLILLGLILALLPIILTSAFPHLVVVSIYAGVVPWLAFAWAILVITFLLRRKRIAEWRENRRIKKLNKKALKKTKR